jgi:hypothetical protein
MGGLPRQQQQQPVSQGNGQRKSCLAVHREPGLATSGIAWEKEGHLLGISVITHEEQGSVMVPLQVDPCEAYVLPGLNGEINGIMIP